METPQVVKLAWEKGFALGQITSHRTYRDGMHLFRFKKPQSYKGRLFRWVIDYGEFDDSGKLLRLRQRLWLLVKTEAAAQTKFKEVDAAKRAYDDQMRRLCAAQPKTPQQQDVDAAQLKVLAQVWPGSVKLMQRAQHEPDPVKRADLHLHAVVEYKAEAFAMSGLLFDDAADEETRRRLSAALRRKRKDFNAVDYELALNWLQRRYCDMKRTDMADAIHRATGGRLRPDAIAKRAERLGLATTSKVKPGPRPRIEA